MSGNVDEGWDYVRRDIHAAHPMSAKSNNDYGKRFCLLLAQRFTGEASEWWVSKKETMRHLPNCWDEPRGVAYQEDRVIYCSFKTLLETAFPDHCKLENAQNQLNSLSWDMSSESVSTFKNRTATLFNKVGIDKWIHMRPYLLKAMTEPLRRELRAPALEADFWKKLDDIYTTEEAISLDRQAGLLAEQRMKKKPGKLGQGTQTSEIKCYTCGEPGHVSPNCPLRGKKKDDSKKTESKTTSRTGRKSSNEDDDDGNDEDVCFKCGGRGHRSPACPSKRTYKQGDQAKKTRGKQSEPKQSANGGNPSSSRMQNHFDIRPLQEELGGQWHPASRGMYAFDTVPVQRFHPPIDVPEDLGPDLIWNGHSWIDPATDYFYSQPVKSAPLVSVPFYSIDSTTSASTTSPTSPLSVPAETLHSSISYIQTMMSSEPVGLPTGSMRTMTDSMDGQKLTTVLDTGTSVVIVTKATLGSSFPVSRPSDITLTSTNNMWTQPLGICDAFKFRIRHVVYTVKAYVVLSAGFDLLLGNEFLWSTGAALFPRWGAFALCFPEFQFLSATCDARPSPTPSQQPSSPTPPHPALVDPLSGEPLESKLFAYFDVSKSVPHLNIISSRGVVAIGQRDYLKDSAMDGEPVLLDSKDEGLHPPHVLTDTFIKSRINIDPSAPTWFVDAVIGIIIQYHDVISWNDYDLGRVVDIPHRIRLRPGTRGVRQPMRPHLNSPRNSEIIRRKTDPFLQMGVWIPCPFSEWCAQLVIAEKERVCHDFTDLNEATIPDAYPTPSMSDMFSCLAGDAIFSMWDADRGFNQIINDVFTMYAMSFQRLRQLLMSLRMLFGGVTCGATFLRNMAIVVEKLANLLREEKSDQKVHSYYDDVILSGPQNSYLGHLKAIKAFLEVSRQHGWKYKASKVRIAHLKIKILGVILSAAGRSPDPEKVDAVTCMRRPSTVSELKSFIGLLYWFLDSYPGLSVHVMEMRAMLTHSRLDWSPAAIAEFESAKSAIRNLATMPSHNPAKHCILYTDACEDGIGCMILQLQDDNTECVIAFGSKAFTPAQKRYHITRQEALAFIWTLGHFHAYLSAKPFLWRTDHRALKFIFDASKSNVACLMRYKLIADEYQFTTEWISGTRMIADPFSRLCVIPADRESAMTTREMIFSDTNYFDINPPPLRLRRCQTADFYYLHAHNVSLYAIDQDPNKDLNPHSQRVDHSTQHKIRLPSLTGTELDQLRASSYIHRFLSQKSLPEGLSPVVVRMVKRYAKRCFIEGDIVYMMVRGTYVRQVVGSEVERRNVLTQAHEGSGHRGLESSLAIVGARYWFPSMSKIVLRHILRCQACQKYSRPDKFDNPNYVVDIYDIFRHWSIDFAGPFPPDDNGYQYVAVMVESLSRWAEIYPCRSAAAGDAANAIYYQIVSRFGIPESIQSDNGSHFVNEIITRLTSILRIRHKFSTPYYPQSNGRVERLIGSLKSMMVRCVEDVNKDNDGVVRWLPAIYTALYVYRASVHHSTGVTPSYLVYGYDIQLPIHYDGKLSPSAEKPPNQIAHKQQILERLSYMKDVIPGLRNAHYRYAISKEGRKVLVRPLKYNVGELVLIANRNISDSKTASPFDLPFVGPYKVHEIGDKGAYKLQTIPKPGQRPGYLRNLVNWTRMRRYFPEGDDEFDGEGTV